MIPEAHARLTRLLDESHRSALAALRGLNPEAIVYADSGWRITDLIGHLAMWQGEVLAAIQAHRAGGEYRIVGFQLDEFNHRGYTKHYQASADQLYARWATGRQQLKEALTALSPEELEKPILYPSGRMRGAISALVQEIIDHEQDHVREAIERTSAGGGERARLIHLLDETHQTALAALQNVDPELVIFTDSGWRVKDLIGHIVAWEQEMLKSLEAYHAGGEYRIPNFTSDDELNAEFHEQRKNEALEQIYKEWDDVRSRMKAVIGAIPADRLQKPFLLPWGARGSVPHLLKDLTGHQEEHVSQILNASRSDHPA